MHDTNNAKCTRPWCKDYNTLVSLRHRKSVPLTTCSAASTVTVKRNVCNTILVKYDQPTSNSSTQYTVLMDNAMTPPKNKAVAAS